MDLDPFTYLLLEPLKVLSYLVPLVSQISAPHSEQVNDCAFTNSCTLGKTVAMLRGMGMPQNRIGTLLSHSIRSCIGQDFPVAGLFTEMQWRFG
ncbi:hypothetical protein FGO68_gene17680 [Halteria grandinella]|uniref:Uncharacterized protein n=1 Tax=Halteria grandinella TaxID=5974 RepID=A0A8J8NC83_HALGN|nr:hypothetical protein FGO68_gene17680 [Halteria grandinella]